MRISTDSQQQKVDRFRRYIEAGNHKTGSIGIRSYREMAEACHLSAWTLPGYMIKYFPEIERQMRRLRSR